MNYLILLDEAGNPVKGEAADNFKRQAEGRLSRDLPDGFIADTGGYPVGSMVVLGGYRGGRTPNGADYSDTHIGKSAISGLQADSDGDVFLGNVYYKHRKVSRKRGIGKKRARVFKDVHSIVLYDY